MVVELGLLPPILLSIEPYLHFSYMFLLKSIESLLFFLLLTLELVKLLISNTNYLSFFTLVLLLHEDFLLLVGVHSLPMIRDHAVFPEGTHTCPCILGVEVVPRVVVNVLLLNPVLHQSILAVLIKFFLHELFVHILAGLRHESSSVGLLFGQFVSHISYL